MARPLRWYLVLLAGLMAISGLGQLVIPEQIAARSAWGFAPGWQREIAFWNFAMYVVTVRTIQRGDRSAGRIIAVGLVLLQALVATNHIVAYVAGGGSLNLTMGMVNFGCAMLGLYALWRDHRDALA